eukprot:11007327-Alexandrium_andersonii.AAC.1
MAQEPHEHFVWLVGSKTPLEHRCVWHNGRRVRFSAERGLDGLAWVQERCETLEVLKINSRADVPSVDAAVLGLAKVTIGKCVDSCLVPLEREERACLSCFQD